MSARYAPLPNPHTDPDAENEMEAAFLESDDEEDEDDLEAHEASIQRLKVKPH